MPKATVRRNSKKFRKIQRETPVMGSFLCKIAELQLAPLLKTTNNLYFQIETNKCSGIFSSAIFVKEKI